MQERYALKLEILTDALKNSISQVKGMIHKFTSDIQKDNKINLGQMSVGNLYAEIGRAQQKIKEFNDDIARKKELGLDSSVAEGNVKRLNDFISAANQRLTEMGARRIDLTGLDKAKEKVKEVGDEAEDTKQKMSGISVSANMTNNTIVNGFSNSWKSIKRFAFSLLSIRGIYGLVRKASSAYMSQDTEMANQMQRTWASLGAMMAPIIERIVHWIRVAAAYINYFVKALTGKDLIGKAVKKINAYNKSLGGTAKAAKSVNKELTTMDEVTNLSFDDGNINDFTDAMENFDTFDDIKLDPKITATLDKWADAAKRLWDNLKPVRDVIKNIVDWAIDHPDAVLTILGGAALLKTLGKLTGTGGLGTFASLLKPLATIGVVVAGVDLIYNAVTGRDLINDLKEIIEGLGGLKNDIKENTKTSEKNTKQNTKLNETYRERIKEHNKSNEQYQNEADLLLRVNKRRQADNKELKKQYTLTGNFNGANKDLNKQWANNDQIMKENLKTLGLMYDKGLLTTEQTKEYKQQLQNQIEYYGKLNGTIFENTETGKKNKKMVEELQTQYEKLTGKEYTPKINVDLFDVNKKVTSFTDTLTNIAKKNVIPKIDVDNKTALDRIKTTRDKLLEADRLYKPTMELKVGTKDAKNKFTDFMKKVSAAATFGGVMDKFRLAGLNSLLAAIPAYDVGTNYVPNDQLAMVHKGEAIVPKKFNNQQFFNNNNEETNALLVELNQNIIELRNRPNVLEVNGKELAQATYNDYQNEGNRLNQSMTIKKVGGN